MNWIFEITNPKTKIDIEIDDVYPCCPGKNIQPIWHEQWICGTRGPFSNAKITQRQAPPPSPTAPAITWHVQVGLEGFGQVWGDLPNHWPPKSRVLQWCQRYVGETWGSPGSLVVRSARVSPWIFREFSRSKGRQSLGTPARHKFQHRGYSWAKNRLIKENIRRCKNTIGKYGLCKETWYQPTLASYTYNRAGLSQTWRALPPVCGNDSFLVENWNIVWKNNSHLILIVTFMGFYEPLTFPGALLRP